MTQQLVIMKQCILELSRTIENKNLLRLTPIILVFQFAQLLS